MSQSEAVQTHGVQFPKMTNHADYDAFDAEGVILFHDDRLHPIVGRVEFYRHCCSMIGLNRGFPMDQGDQGLAVAGGAWLLHHDDIAG